MSAGLGGERASRRMVVGLGNPAAGDDGVGWRVAERLAAHPRLPHDVEVLCGGADLLRLAPRLAGCAEVLFVDACLDVPSGALEIADHATLAAAPARAHAHHLSAVDAAELLIGVGDLPASGVRWALAGVGEVRRGEALTPALSAALPSMVDAVLAAIGAGARGGGVLPAVEPTATPAAR